MMDVRLVAIDIQNDFVDPKGSLYVQNAEKDVVRVAELINRLGPKINDIHVTLDSHTYTHIATPLFWKDKKGNHPNPFTPIDVQDVEDGTFRATKPSLQSRALNYVKTLAKNNRYKLFLWPFHCIIGSEGQALHPEFQKAIKKWSFDNFAYPDYITKGSNMLTEHYSAVQADVPDMQDPSTQLNVGFINTLAEADMILFTGQASSHCVFNSLADTVNNFADPSYAKKIKLLKDTMSFVPGFEAKQDELFAFCAKHGIEVLNSTEVLI